VKFLKFTKKKEPIDGPESLELTAGKTTQNKNAHQEKYGMGFSSVPQREGILETIPSGEGNPENCTRCDPLCQTVSENLSFPQTHSD
jgi:hypothetical protein